MRRLLHSIVNEAPFTVVMAGHSAAAAHGNHGNQSMTHFLHSALAPALAAVGVRLVTRNHAMGGLGSDHRASCFATSYGDDVDMLLWDYAMTAHSGPEMDYLFRQAMMQPRKPVLVHMGAGQHPILRQYEAVGYHVAATNDKMYEHWASADGWQDADGVPKITTTSHEQAATMPPGLRYVWCRGIDTKRGEAAKLDSMLSTTCRDMRFDCRCSVDPEFKYGCGGQASWHPTYRIHRISGHMLAALLFDVLEQANALPSDPVSSERPSVSPLECGVDSLVCGAGTLCSSLAHPAPLHP